MSSVALSQLVASALACVALAACGATDESAAGFDCATADVRPYSQLGEVFAHCTPCHKGNGAPQSVRFDSYADASANAGRGAAEIAAGRMPQGGGMPDSAKDLFTAWAKCGTPE